MHEQTERQLRIAVERVVRPIRAGRKRKLQMREELLGHLTAVFEEELAGQTDEAAAVAQAVTRLGEPATLTRELQQSVPWLDRVERQNASRSVWWNTRQLLALVIPTQLIILALVVTATAGFGLAGVGGKPALARLMTPASLGRLVTIFLLSQPLMVFWSWSFLMFSGAFNGMYQQKRSWRRAAAVWLAQVGLLALLGVIGFPYSAGVAPSPNLLAWVHSTPVQTLAFYLAIPLALAMGVVHPVVAWVEGRQYRRVRPWHELPLPEA